MQVALYARVSTERQEQQGTIASQLDALARGAREQHHDVVDAYVCVDDGYSGARLDRPGLDRLRDGAEAGAFEAALVLCPDRLARKYAYQILILEELERFDVQVIFLDQPLSDDPQARLLTQIQGAVAEYERIKIAERYRRGKLFRARQGEVCWWKVPYGYRRIPRRDGVPAHVEVSEPEAQVVRQIFRWHVDERLSVRQIALRLTESAHVTATGLPRWGTSTVTRMLHNEAYIGTMYYNRHESVSCCDPRSTSRRRPTRLQARPTAEWIPLPVPPIIDPDLFRRSQTIHHDNSRFSPRHLKSGHYLLRRVVRCRVCDLAMSCHRMRGRNGTFHHYYYCAGHDVLYARRTVGRCPQRNLRADELDDLVWGEVRRHLEHPALIREGYKRLQVQAASPQDDGSADDLRALQKQLTELDREEHRLLDAYQAGLVDLDQLRQRQERLRQRRAHVTGSIEVLHAERKTAQQQAQLQTDLETFVDTIRGPLATLDFDARQQLVRTVLERVMVEDGRVDIHFAIPLPDPPPDTTNPSVSTLFHLRSNGNEDLDVVGEAVDERDGAGGVGEDGVPLLEGQVGGEEQGAVLVTAADELEEEVGGARVVGEVSDLVDDEQCGPGVVTESAFEGASGLLAVEVEEQVGGGGEEGGVAGEDGLVGDVLGEHGFPEALRADEDYVLATGEEVEGEDALEDGAVERSGPVPVPVGEGLEATEASAGEAAFDAASLTVFELVGDEAFEEDGGAPALAGGLCDAVVEVVCGAEEPEASEVSRQGRRRRYVVGGHRRTPGHGSGRRGLVVRAGRAG